MFISGGVFLSEKALEKASSLRNLLKNVKNAVLVIFFTKSFVSIKKRRTFAADFD